MVADALVGYLNQVSDLQLFRIASQHILSSGTYFKNAKRLFDEFKQKYPDLGNVEFTAQDNATIFCPQQTNFGGNAAFGSPPVYSPASVGQRSAYTPTGPPSPLYSPASVGQRSAYTPTGTPSPLYSPASVGQRSAYTPTGPPPLYSPASVGQRSAYTPPRRPLPPNTEQRYSPSRTFPAGQQQGSFVCNARSSPPKAFINKQFPLDTYEEGIDDIDIANTAFIESFDSSDGNEYGIQDVSMPNFVESFNTSRGYECGIEDVSMPNFDGSYNTSGDGGLEDISMPNFDRSYNTSGDGEIGIEDIPMPNFVDYDAGSRGEDCLLEDISEPEYYYDSDENAS